MHTKPLGSKCIHSPNGLTNWTWNSVLSLLQWLYNFSSESQAHLTQISLTVHSAQLDILNGEKLGRVALAYTEMHGWSTISFYFPSVSLSVYFCENYVVRHFNGTGLPCAPPTGVVTSCDVMMSCVITSWRHVMSWNDVMTSCDVTAWRHVMSRHDVMWRHRMTSWRHLTSRNDVMMSCDVTEWHHDIRWRHKTKLLWMLEVH